jgi:hypothetical protein
MNRKLFGVLIFIALAMALPLAVPAQHATAGPAKLKGIEYGFDRKSAPEFDRQALYVVFYGFGKKGVDRSTGKPYPVETRRVFSRIYRLGDLPYGYNWNSMSLAPHQMSLLFFDHLVKEYDFDRNLHDVKYFKTQYLSTIESDLVEMFKEMKKSEIVVPDTKFSFTYEDTNYVRPYSFEYKSP